MPQGRSPVWSVRVAPAASARASTASTSARLATRQPRLNSPVFGGPNATFASFASSVRGYNARVSPPRSWNMAAAPAGVVSSPMNSVPITPGDSSPRPSRSNSSARSRSPTARVITSTRGSKFLAAADLLLGHDRGAVPVGRRRILHQHSALIAVQSGDPVSRIRLQRLLEPLPGPVEAGLPVAHEPFVERAYRLHQVGERVRVVVVEALEDRDRLGLALHDHLVDLAHAVDALQLRLGVLGEEDPRSV